MSLSLLLPSIAYWSLDLFEWIPSLLLDIRFLRHFQPRYPVIHI